MSWTRTLVIPLLVVGMLGVYSYRMLAAESTRFDDAYMFLRYAANILEGNGFAWNPGGHERTGAPALPMLSWLLGHAPSFRIAPAEPFSRARQPSSADSRWFYWRSRAHSTRRASH